MDDQLKKDAIAGPAIVAVANGMRALDAPVRYPLLQGKYSYLWSGDITLTNALTLSGYSSFLVTVEHLLGVLLLLPILLFRRGFGHLAALLRTFNRRDWVSLLLVSIGSGLGLYFFLIAFGLGNPTVAILVQKSQPLITVLVAMVVIKERPSRLFYIGTIIATVGISLLVFSDITDPERVVFDLLGALASLAAAFFWGSNTIWGRILTDKVDDLDLTTLRYIGGSIVLIVFNFLIFAYTPENFAALTQSFTTFPAIFPIEMLGIIALIYAVILTGGIIPLALYYYGLRRSKASVAGLAELAFPVLAIFVNDIALGYRLNGYQFIGAMILIGVVSYMSWVNAKEYEKAPEPVTASDTN